MIQGDPVIQRFIRWGQEQKAVRAMLLTGSRASPNASADGWSDYDLVLVVEDIRPFFVDRTWLQDSGQVVVAYWDPIHPAPDFAGAIPRGDRETRAGTVGDGGRGADRLGV